MAGWKRESGAAEGCGSQFFWGEFCQRYLFVPNSAAHRAAGVSGGTDCRAGGTDFLSVEADRQLHHHHSRHRDTLGAIILGEIGDIHRFDAPNKLVAFAGLDVRVTQSGEFTGTRQKISKRGSPYLRRAIWLAASRAAFCDPILSEYYQSLRARGKHHLTAIGAVSRKLCNIIFAILNENRPYEAVPPKGIRHDSASFTT